MRSLLFIGISLFFGYSYTQTTGTITDARDGKVYKTVVIGNQTWMAENLNVDKFRNGDPIPEAKTKEEWKKAGEEGKPVWCYYNNDSTNGRIFGKLYNWYCVNDSRGLAPEGWQIPTDLQWKELTIFLGDEEIAGQKMKSKNGWSENGNGSNDSGFSGLPGGNRTGSGRFFNPEFGKQGIWWSKDDINHFAYHFYLLDDGILPAPCSPKQEGLSVRCIKD